MKPIPERGDELVLTCRGCSKSNLMKIKSIKKNAQNEDGSWCYTVKAVCNICGFMNGDYRPIWYNFYRIGIIDFRFYIYLNPFGVFSFLNSSEVMRTFPN